MSSPLLMMRLFFRNCLILMTILLVCHMPLTVLGACNFTVTSNLDSGSNTLREAIGYANLCGSPPSTITFSSDMTITLDSEIVMTKDVIVKGGEYNIVLNGNNTTRIFYSNTSIINITLQNLNFENGKVTSTNKGGAIYFSGDTITIQDSRFSQNKSSSQGGAIYLLSPTTVTIEQSRFDDNEASSSGGAIYIKDGVLTVENSNFSKNKSSNNSGGAIYAFYATAVTTIENSTFAENDAEKGGGGIYQLKGTLTVKNSYFYKNKSHNIGGGAIGVFNATGVTIAQNAFDLNQALSTDTSKGYGGALEIHVATGNTTAIERNTFYRNSAGNRGGGLRLRDTGIHTLTNNTFLENAAINEGSSLYILSGATVHVRNSLFANGLGTAPTECAGITLTTDLNNLASTGGCGMSSNGAVGTTLGAFTNNGGNTPTIALLSGSPAIDAGDTTTCTTHDQRGFAWQDGDGDGMSNCDIGAYAFQNSSIPELPSDFTLVKMTEQFLILGWTENLYTESFSLKRNDWLDSVALTYTDYTDRNIACGRDYTYYLAANNSYGKTSNVLLKASTFPCPVTNFSATPLSDTQITLDWSDASTNHTGYKLLRDDVLIAELRPEVRRYNDDSLICDMTYAYQLIQQSTTGDSTPLDTSVLLNCPIPTPPTALTATTIETEAVNLSWTDNSDNEQRFILKRDGVNIAVLNPDSTNHRDGSVVCGQSYTYSVLARNDSGDSVASTLNVATLACPIEYTLTLNVNGEGTINDCGASCQQTHFENTQLSFTVQAANNWTFSHWSGDCDVNGQMTLTADQNCTAHFTPLAIVGPDQPTSSTPQPASNSNTLSPPTPSGTTPNTIQLGQSVSGELITGDINNAGVLANVTIAEGARVTGGTVSSTITNHGTLNDLTVSQYSIVNGGYLAGTIINKGTLNNVTLLPGSIVQGGKLSGLIKNQGTFINILLSSGTKMHGGAIGGNIHGDADSPGYLGDLAILPDSRLSNLHLSPTTQWSETLILDNVTFAARPNNPTPQDFGIDPEQLASANANTLAQLEPAAFSVLLPSDIAQLSPAALLGLDSEAIHHLTPAAVQALSVDQFNALSLDCLSELTAENLAGLSPAVLNQLETEQIAALDAEAVQASAAVAQMFTNIDPDAVDTTAIINLLPKNWTIDLNTGVIKPAVGARLGFQAIIPDNLPENISVPILPNLNSTLAIGGDSSNANVSSLNNSLRASLRAENLAQFELSQSETGLLLVEERGLKLAFMPNNMLQVNLDKVSVGVDQTEGGFYQVTTPEGYQFVMMPAPQDPLALTELLGETGQLRIHSAGDVWLTLEADALRRNLHVHQVVLFDPFLEQAPPEDLPGVYTDRVVYPNGTMQAFFPTFPSPATFIAEALKISGVQNVILTHDGSCKVIYEDIILWAVPTGEVQRFPLAPGERVLPSVRHIPDGFLYTLQDNTEILQTYFVVRERSHN